jgi:hypothetical protein
MGWQWDWDDWNGKRPLLATIICAVTIVISGKTLLRAFHLLPPLTSFPEPTDHLLLRHVLKIVEPVLNLIGAVYLWQMKPFATTLFAAEAVLLTIVGFYLNFIDPSPHTRSHLVERLSTPVYLLMVAFEFGLTVYVWRITSRLQEEQTR